LHFLLAGAVAAGLLISAPDSAAHGGGGHGGGGHGGGGNMFHGGWHSGGFHGHGRHFFHGRFFGPGFGFYGYGYPWWDWDYAYYPYPYYGDDAYYSGPYDSDHDPRFFSTRSIQAALAWRGYYSGRIDGVMGPETRRAIRSFQVHQDLPVTGQIDNGLINALRR
jgi:hypothetical protein